MSTDDLTNPYDCYDEIAARLRRVQEDAVTQIASKLMPAVLGYEQDSWGHVKEISPQLKQEILSRLDPGTLEDLYDKLAKNMETQIKSARTNYVSMAREIVKNMVSQHYEVMRKVADQEIKLRFAGQIEAEVKRQMVHWTNFAKLKKEAGK